MTMVVTELLRYAKENGHHIGVYDGKVRFVPDLPTELRRLACEFETQLIERVKIQFGDRE